MGEVVGVLNQHEGAREANHSEPETSCNFPFCLLLSAGGRTRPADLNMRAPMTSCTLRQRATLGNRLRRSSTCSTVPPIHGLCTAHSQHPSARGRGVFTAHSQHPTRPLRGPYTPRSRATLTALTRATLWHICTSFTALTRTIHSTFTPFPVPHGTIFDDIAILDRF